MTQRPHEAMNGEAGVAIDLVEEADLRARDRTLSEIKAQIADLAVQHYELKRLLTSKESNLGTLIESFQHDQQRFLQRIQEVARAHGINTNDMSVRYRLEFSAARLVFQPVPVEGAGQPGG